MQYCIHVCMFFVKRPCITTSVLHCARGCTLVQNKSCMNLYFYSYHELFTCPLTFDFKVHARSSDEIQNFAIRKPYIQHKNVCVVPVTACTEASGTQRKHSENTLTWTQFGIYQALLLISTSDSVVQLCQYEG